MRLLRRNSAGCMPGLGWTIGNGWVLRMHRLIASIVVRRLRLSTLVPMSTFLFLAPHTVVIFLSAAMLFLLSYTSLLLLASLLFIRLS